MEPLEQGQQQFAFQVGADKKGTESIEGSAEQDVNISKSSQYTFRFPPSSAPFLTRRAFGGTPIQAATMDSCHNHASHPTASFGMLHVGNCLDAVGSRLPSVNKDVEDLRRNWESSFSLQARHSDFNPKEAASTCPFNADDIRLSSGKNTSHSGAVFDRDARSTPGAAYSCAGKVAFKPEYGTGAVPLSTAELTSGESDVDPSSVSLLDIRLSNSENGSHNVFVFGASGALEKNSRHGRLQQKGAHFSGAGSLPKRLSKLKKQKRSLNGKLVLESVVSVQQHVSPTGTGGSGFLGSKAEMREVSSDGNAECSHASVSVVARVDASECETSRLGQDQNMQCYRGPTSNMHSRTDPEQIQKMRDKFESWDPFLHNGSEVISEAGEGGHCQVDNCFESDESILKLITALKQFGSPLGEVGRRGHVGHSGLGKDVQTEASLASENQGQASLNNRLVEELCYRIEKLGKSNIPKHQQAEMQIFVEKLRQRLEKLGRSDVLPEEQEQSQESVPPVRRQTLEEAGGQGQLGHGGLGKNAKVEISLVGEDEEEFYLNDILVEELCYKIEKLVKSNIPVHERAGMQESMKNCKPQVEKPGVSCMSEQEKDNQEIVPGARGKVDAYPCEFRASQPCIFPTKSDNEISSKTTNDEHGSYTIRESKDTDKRSLDHLNLGTGDINPSEFSQTPGFTCPATTATTQFDSIVHEAASCSSFVSIPFPKLDLRFNLFNVMQRPSFASPYSKVHINEMPGPVGEFAGPTSSSESSASGGSPGRSEDWTCTDSWPHVNVPFKFQGGSGFSQLSAVKKKAHIFSARRKTRRSMLRQKKYQSSQGRLHSNSCSMEGISSPMDFSPSTGEITPNSRPGCWEDTSYGVMPNGNTQEWWTSEAHLAVEELRAAAAKLNLGMEEGSAMDGESTFVDVFGSDYFCQRNSKSKRSSPEEALNTSIQVANIWGTHQNSEKDETQVKTHVGIGASEVVGNSSNPSSAAFIVGTTSQFASAANEHPWGTQGKTQAEIEMSSGMNRIGEFAPGIARPGSSDGVKIPFHQEKLALSSKGHSDPAFPEQSALVEQLCERWRKRGNKAYACGDFSKAEEYYSRGANSVPPNETSQSCVRAAMLCYSNRAATRMAVGRMREALADCMRAMVVDPNFFRVRLRAASCYLALGEIEASARTFRECLKQAKDGSKPDSKIIADAMEGIKKTQQFEDYMERSSKLLHKGNLTDYMAILRLLNEALLISPYSEVLLEMKAQALLFLRRFEEVIELCDQTLESAKRNYGAVISEEQHREHGDGAHDNIFFKMWRWHMSAKSLFHLGKLEESLDLLEKHEEALPFVPTNKAAIIESVTPLVSCIRDLLHHKAAGNEDFQAGRYVEAIEHYTAALMCNSESRPYRAVCFCNRAAASQFLGHIADAIADCSCAVALNPNYPKAISRRATLHDMVRDYGQACMDLQRLIMLLESSQPNGKKNSQPGRIRGQNCSDQDLRQARDRLAKSEEDMKKSYPINHYLLLGVEASCSANEIKRAYRKAALKHHPDKAGQLLVRSDNGDDGAFWREVGEQVCRDAERLFKMIGEAYAILSDPVKRLRYDTEEEHRNSRAGNAPVSVSGASDGYHSQFVKTNRRQHEWYAWNGYVPRYQRWKDAPDAAQPDTYARRSTHSKWI